MQLKAILVGLATLGAFVASAPTDGEDITERQFPSGPQCYCCTGYVIQDLAGTKCTNAGTCSQCTEIKCTAKCGSKPHLFCANGAIVWPPTGPSSSVVCQS